MRASRWVVASAFAVVALVGLARPAPVRAECPYFPIPPATDAAPSAREVIVGTVIQNFNESADDFRLRIDHVLRGPADAGDVRRFKALFPRWPFNKDEDGRLTLTPEGKPFPPCAPIPGWKGNVIAFSLGALAPDGKTRYNAASWIKGNVPYRRDDLPRTTLAEMRAIAALPSTDTLLSRSGAPAAVSGPILLLIVGVFSFAFSIVTLGRKHRWQRRP